MIWNSPSGPVPVFIKRRGPRNYRCVMPDGSEPLIPKDDLLATNPSETETSGDGKEPKAAGYFSWLWCRPFVPRNYGRQTNGRPWL